MNIKIIYFNSLQDTISYTEDLRANGTNDVVVVVRTGDSTGVVLSKNYLGSNIGDVSDVELLYSTRNFGEYSNVISIPETTFNVIIPTNTVEQFTLQYIDAMYLRLFEGCEKVRNDFIVNGRKIAGTAIFKDIHQHYLISSLSRFPVEIDKVYSTSWLDSQKTLPSRRVEGYRELTNNPETTIMSFAEDLKYRMNEQLSNTIENIIEEVIK